MSEAFLEYNLGTVGYEDVAELNLVAFKDGNALFGLTFHDPKNKRLKPIGIALNSSAFAIFHNLLIDTEVQVNKLLTTGKMSALVLPHVSDIHFRSQLGSVKYLTRSLSVSILVMRNGTGCLQFIAQDAKSRSNGFGVILDDDEFTKLKKALAQSYDELIKPTPKLNDNRSAESGNSVREVRNKKFITVSMNGKIAPLDIRNICEARLALQQLRLVKKEKILRKQNIDEKIRQIRIDYSNQRARQGSKIHGGGLLGAIVRTFQTVDRDNQRLNIAVEIEPLEKHKRYLQDLIFTLNRYEIELNKIMLGKNE